MKLNSCHIIACLAGLSSVTAAPSDKWTVVTAEVRYHHPLKARTIIFEGKRTDQGLPQYDDLPDTFIVAPIRTYRGLSYNDWSYASQPALAVGVVASRSFPNRLASGSMATQSIAPETPAYKAFALLDFHYGCVARILPTVSQPVTCTITVTGYAASTGKLVTTTTLNSVPPPPVSVGTVPMDHAIMPISFYQRLEKVTFSVSNPTTTVVLVDNLSYNLFTS